MTHYGSRSGPVARLTLALAWFGSRLNPFSLRRWIRIHLRDGRKGGKQKAGDGSKSIDQRAISGL